MITFRMAQIEVDDDLVLDLIEQSKGRSLRRVGFATRQTAMESIVDGAGPSQPGSPPNSHTGVLRRSIRYEYDQITSTMTAGPILLSRRSRDAVEAMESGGQSYDVRGRIVRVRARPFMSPAFADVLENSVPKVFENTFH